MNKLLIRLCTAIMSLGMLGAAACSGCSPSTDTGNTSTMAKPSMTCGAYTHRVGNQCVGNTNSSAAPRNTNGSPSTLNTSGNN